MGLLDPPALTKRQADALVGATDIGFDVVLIVGQSNAVGQVAGSSAIDTTYLDPIDNRIMQWPNSGSFAALGRPIVAVDPLFHLLQIASCVGPGMAFARELLRRTKPNRKILLVPAARGGTGFTTSSLASPPGGYYFTSGGGWDVTGAQGGINLYENAIAQANAAIAYNPNNRIVAAIWVQGEADALTQSQYAAKLDALIDGFRSRITGATNMPFIIGQMVPERIAADSTTRTINAAHVDTPRRKTLTAFNYGVTGHNDGLVPPLHYDNEGQRLNGTALVSALDYALANVLGTPPVTPGAVTLSQPGAAVAVSWKRTIGRVTDYNVRYRKNGGSWTSLTRAQSIDVTASIDASTMSSGDVVDVQVQSVNEQGVSGWTSSATITIINTGLIDQTGVSAYRAYGLRKLRTAYSGPAIRVRYTDATEADIGFTAGGDLDTTTLLAGTAAHGGSAYIKTWYDQSGNSRNITQATTAQQARIVNANTVDTKNGKPAAVFLATNYIDTTNVQMYAAAGASFLAVYSSTKGTSAALVCERGATSMNYSTGFQNASTGVLSPFINDDAGATFASLTGPVLADATLSQVAFVDTGTSLQNWVDRSTTAAAAYSRTGHTLTPASHVFGSTSTGGVYLNGQVCELIEFSAALTTGQRQAGSSNQQAYYATA